MFSSSARAMEGVRSGGVRATAERTSDGRMGFTTARDLMSQAETMRALGKNCVALERGDFNEPTEHAGRGALHKFEAGIIWVIECPNNAREGFSQRNTGRGKKPSWRGENDAALADWVTSELALEFARRG